MVKQIVNRRPNDLDLAYSAGILDGEGCIKICRVSAAAINRPNDRFTLDIQVNMTDKEVVEWLYNTFGGYFYLHRSFNPRWKNSYRWYLQYQSCRNFLEWVLPYLRVKREQAKLALKYLDIKRRDVEAKRVIYAKLKLLNERGPGK